MLTGLVWVASGVDGNGYQGSTGAGPNLTVSTTAVLIQLNQHSPIMDQVWTSKGYKFVIPSPQRG